MVSTFALVCLGWIFFRAHSFSDALVILQRLVTDAANLETYFLGLARVTAQPAGNLIFLAVAALFTVEWLQRRQPHPLTLAHWPHAARWAVYFTVACAILYGGTHGSGQFIYFQF